MFLKLSFGARLLFSCPFRPSQNRFIKFLIKSQPLNSIFLIQNLALHSYFFFGKIGSDLQVIILKYILLFTILFFHIFKTKIKT